MFNANSKEPEMNKYTFSNELYSDLHKDVYGCRPGETGFRYWSSLDAEGKQQEWDNLIATLSEMEAEKREFQAKQVEKFEARIALTIRCGAKDRVTAIRWILDCEDQLDLKFFGADKVAYEHGFPYNHPLVDEINSVIATMFKEAA